MSDDTFDQVREATWLSPTSAGLAAPPGFDTPLPSVEQEVGSSSPQTPHRIVPALPITMHPATSQRQATPEQTPQKGSKDAKKSIKALATETGLSKAISSRAVVPESGSGNALQDEDFPALNTPKAAQKQSRVVASTPKATPAFKKLQLEKATENKEEEKIDGSTAKTKTTELKMASNISKATSATAPPKVTEVAGTSNTEKPASISFPALPTPSTVSPARPPKTLRVVPTPKAEVPPVASPVSAVSRALSLSHRPDTPASELISDTASIVSASVSASRAGSPPPSRVGAAAIRSTTKSQQRKQRKDALKQDAKAIVETANEESEEQAPIIGRKKKQKKEKAPKASTQGQPPSPTRERPAAPEKRPEEPAPTKKMDEKVKPEPAATPKKASKGKGKAVERPVIREEPFNLVETKPEISPKETPEDDDSDQTEKPQLGPFSVFQDIKNSLWTSAVDSLYMLKPVTSGASRDHSHKHGAGASTALAEVNQCKDYICKCGEIQEADLAALRAGKAVRKQFHIDGSRMLITPNGDCIRGLTPAEEDAFLELQESIASSSENPGSFIAPRHQPVNGAFSLIKGRAVPNGRPGIFPASMQPQPQDPIGKLQREDALSYINQYVLPRLNLGATNVGWPKGATLRQDAAAASLNSLAPYFYGPDAAAGVGIYSAPDGKDFYNPPPPLTSATPTASTPDPDANKQQGQGQGQVQGPYSLSGMPLMSVEDSEGALAAARKETEKLEKGLNQVIKRNRRLLLGSGN